MGMAPGAALPAILGALQNRTQNPGAAQGGPGASLARQSAELQGSDPTMVLRQLESVNQVLGVLFVKTFQESPNIANQISATMKALSRAIKEAQQGSSVQQVVGRSEEGMGPQPIQFGPAMSGLNMQAEAGGPGGIPPL